MVLCSGGATRILLLSALRGEIYVLFGLLISMLYTLLDDYVRRNDEGGVRETNAINHGTSTRRTLLMLLLSESRTLISFLQWDIGAV